ncbi:hypothetical protein Asru_1187_01 [Acidisphaera rubrifaciens HS-AP3]|uniref:Organic solvent tolerance-like N-terminal domain-containing protein n=1 Tax=Acidisphaera rubrifaciens HS-AP3 TaxID=1231350 RepID=A0A0D6PCH7_9PROT|nr:hypothetical protein Asru_1187_01 [Acidisphaera rubrifaciens HS-AP3]
MGSLIGLVVLGLVAATAGARAQPIDMSHGGPITVTAENGLEWHQNDQTVIATGNAHATRGDVTVTADRLIAHYRRKADAAGGAKADAKPDAKPAASGKPDATSGAIPGGPGDTGSSEIYRVEAIGDVHIDTPTDHATAQRAIYDIDQAVLLMTGSNLRVVTPNDTLTARDSMEYWSQKHMAVARGNAVVVTNDGRRISADVLVAYTVDNAQKTPAAPPAATKAAAHPDRPDDPLAASGKLQKVEAFGNVVIRTQTDYVTGDRGVYVPETGIARVVGHVRITRGQNQLNGEEAEVNLKTNISRLLSAPHTRVQGLVVPNDATAQAGGTQAAGKKGADKKDGKTAAAPADAAAPGPSAGKQGAPP